MPQAYRQAKQQAAASQKNHSSSFIPMTFPFAARLKSIQDFFFEASLATQRECVVIGLLLTHLLLGLAYMFSANVKIYQSGLVIGLVGLGVSALTSGLSPASSSSSASSIDSTGIRVGPEVSQSSTGDASWIGPQAILLVMLLSAPFPMAFLALPHYIQICYRLSQQSQGLIGKIHASSHLLPVSPLVLKRWLERIEASRPVGCLLAAHLELVGVGWMLGGLCISRTVTLLSLIVYLWVLQSKHAISPLFRQATADWTMAAERSVDHPACPRVLKDLLARIKTSTSKAKKHL